MTTTNFDAAKDFTRETAQGAKTTAFGVVKNVGEIFTLLRALGVDDLLRPVGLMRRRSPFGSFAAFGAGLAMGVGVGMLFAPMSGADARSFVRSRARKAMGDAKRGVKETAEKVEHAAEETVDKAFAEMDRAHHEPGTASRNGRIGKRHGDVREA